MDKKVKSLFSDAILDDFLKRYGLKSAEPVKFAFENLVYFCSKNGKDYVLRITHSDRRPRNLVQAEVNWINYLYENDVPAAVPNKSANNEWVETFNVEGGYFSAVLFNRAKGNAPTEENHPYKQVGEATAKMHKLALNYKEPPGYQRPDWEPEHRYVDKYIRKEDIVIAKKWNEIMDYVAKLPKDSKSFGLIHSDVHGGNFAVDENNNITLFDFDDINYCWFIFDIAMSMYYSVYHILSPEERNKKIPKYFNDYMEGYSKHFSLDKKWFSEIPHFLRLRDILLHILIYRTMGDDYILGRGAERIKNRKERIENDEPFVDFNFRV
ncbi:MAG TPA: phosphotransferase [Ignavibacteria bacterium]|nr:phosphotransferase [Ignavibacteria bacterium]